MIPGIILLYENCAPTIIPIIYILIPNSPGIVDYLNFKDSGEVVDISNIELPDLKGELVRLSSLKGKYVLLEFWASWCAPCRAENPQLLKVYNKYKSKGFEIYAISLDENKENWMDAVEKDSINWITVSDLKGPNDSKIAMAFDVKGIPKNFLLDQEGKIIDQDLRGDKLAVRLEVIFKDK